MENDTLSGLFHKNKTHRNKQMAWVGLDNGLTYILSSPDWLSPGEPLTGRRAEIVCAGYLPVFHPAVMDKDEEEEEEEEKEREEG